MLATLRACAQSGTDRLRGWSRSLSVEAPRAHLLVVGHPTGETLSGAERGLLDVLSAVDRDRFHLSCLLPGLAKAPLTARAREVARRVDELLLSPYGWSSPASSSPEWVERLRALYLRKGVTLVHVNTLTLLDPLRARGG